MRAVRSLFLWWFQGPDPQVEGPVSPGAGPSSLPEYLSNTHYPVHLWVTVQRIDYYVAAAFALPSPQRITTAATTLSRNSHDEWTRPVLGRVCSVSAFPVILGSVRAVGRPGKRSIFPTVLLVSRGIKKSREHWLNRLLFLHLYTVCLYLGAGVHSGELLARTLQNLSFWGVRYLTA